jgi:hypothetical protein
MALVALDKFFSPKQISKTSILSLCAQAITILGFIGILGNGAAAL